MPAGALARDVPPAFSPNLAKAALAAVVDGKARDLSYPMIMTPWSVSSPPQPEASRSSPQHRAPAGRLP